jgi:DNA polymerase-1
VAPQVFLIDGNSLVYRAFFALPDTIATSKGEPTNAIFGFASMLVKLMTEYGSVPTLVVWDAGWSGREEVYTEYKAERKSRPDLLRDQWPALHPLVEAFGYQNVKVQGADFRGANLFAADLTRAVGDDETSFEGANVKRVVRRPSGATRISPSPSLRPDVMTTNA